MTYLDTSALVRAWRLKLAPENVTRPHAVAEFYASLTRGLTVPLAGVPTRIQFSPETAAQAARETFAKMKFQELDGRTTLEETGKAAQKNIHGPNIHDWLHAVAADKSGCKEIVTTNEKHFKLVTKLPLKEPSVFFA